MRPEQNDRKSDRGRDERPSLSDRVVLVEFWLLVAVATIGLAAGVISVVRSL